MNLLAELIGESPGITAVRETIGRLLQRHSDPHRLPPILIQGETGTGKGILARAIHRAGPRRDGPFVDVNCAAIPETLLESELFGFERGAFTDARQAKPGLFQTANRGTIFLDEAGLLPGELQAKFLTVIEEQVVRRLGSTRSEAVDVWVLSATSQDLLAATRAQRFREDLYHRLAVLTLSLPPLRERGTDILLLAEHFLARACADYGRSPQAFTPDARAALLAYPWPGNIRELANVMERVALLAEAPMVTAELLGLAPPPEPGGPVRRKPGGVPDRDQILEALRQTNWNISHAAARLGIYRNTLRYWMEKYRLRAGEAPPPTAQRTESPAAPPRVVPAAVAAPGPSRAGLRWDQRRLALLRAALIAPPEAAFPPDTGRILEILTAKVQSFGGRIEELSASGATAAFGLEPIEDAPRRAALAAIAIQKAVERLRGPGAEAIAVKAAIHVEEFMLGRVGEMPVIDQGAKREAWTVLDALLERAEPGVILVSEEAKSLLERRFDLLPVDAWEGAPRQAYRLSGPERTDLGRRMVTFVGRHQELELLRSHLASAVRGDGQVIGIAGEPGIGKSRLLYELRQSLREERVAYWEGHCLSYGTAIPYLPVLDILRCACGIIETDIPEAMSEKVRARLRAVEMDPEEGAPYLLHLLGLKDGTEPLDVLSAEAIQARTFDILRQMTFKASRQHALVLAVENLHWIDKTSEEYLASMVEQLANAPILLLVTHRPGYRPPWIERSYATHIALRPLSPQDSLSVARSVLQTSSIPDSLATAILGKAEGNPFFIEELALAMAEGQTQAVPDTVQEVLLARIHRLPDEPRRLLQTASVLGREVSLRLLSALWAGPGRLDPHLRELTRQEFLSEQTGAAELLYVFKHALTREVARESLPLAERMALHAAAGRALEALYADRLEEAVDRLAYHYSKGKQADKAAEYLTRSAERAARGYAHVEAVVALQEALVHVERLPTGEQDRTVLELVLGQARSLAFLGRFQETLELLLSERHRLERLGDPSLGGRYHFWLSHTYSYLGDQERAVRSAQQALEEAGRCGDEATMGKACLVLAQESSWAGQADRGIEHGHRAAELLERAGERWWLGLAHWVVGINYITLGHFEQALEAEARARAVGEALGDPRIQSYAAWSTGWIHALKGEAEAGLEAFQRALEHSPDPVNTAVIWGHLGYAYLEKEDPGEAIPLLEKAVEEMRRFRFLRLEGRFTTFLGEAYLQEGQVEKARELVSHGLQISREAKYWYGVGWAQLALGRIAQARGALSEAEAHLAAALETFSSVGAQFMVARSRLGLGELAHVRGNRDATVSHLAEAHRLFKTLRVPMYEKRTRQLSTTYDAPLAE